jgi:hypothetical protein
VIQNATAQSAVTPSAVIQNAMVQSAATPSAVIQNPIVARCCPVATVEKAVHFAAHSEVTPSAAAAHCEATLCVEAYHCAAILSVAGEVQTVAVEFR